MLLVIGPRSRMIGKEWSLSLAFEYMLPVLVAGTPDQSRGQASPPSRGQVPRRRRAIPDLVEDRSCVIAANNSRHGHCGGGELLTSAFAGLAHGDGNRLLPRFDFGAFFRAGMQSAAFELAHNFMNLILCHGYYLCNLVEYAPRVPWRGCGAPAVATGLEGLKPRPNYRRRRRCGVSSSSSSTGASA